jgi:hypothetical protein
METTHSQFTFNQTYKVMSSTGKVMLTMFWDSQGVPLAHFLKRGENVISASYHEVMLKLQDAIRRKHSGQLATVVDIDS